MIWLIIYLIGFIIVFCGYIYSIKDCRGYVVLKDLIQAVIIAILSWIILISVLFVYLYSCIQDKINWNKKIF